MKSVLTFLLKWVAPWLGEFLRGLLLEWDEAGVDETVRALAYDAVEYAESYVGGGNGDKKRDLAKAKLEAGLAKLGKQMRQSTINKLIELAHGALERRLLNHVATK